jgi:hypothetical protein
MRCRLIRTDAVDSLACAYRCSIVGPSLFLSLFAFPSMLRCTRELRRGGSPIMGGVRDASAPKSLHSTAVLVCPALGTARASPTISLYSVAVSRDPMMNGLLKAPPCLRLMGTLRTPGPAPSSHVSDRRLPATVKRTLGSSIGAAPAPLVALGSHWPPSASSCSI